MVIKSRESRKARHLAKMEKWRSAFEILTSQPTGKRPLGRYRRKCDNSIRMHLRGVSVNTRNCVYSAQNRLLESPCEWCIEPPGSISHGVSLSIFIYIFLYITSRLR